MLTFIVSNSNYSTAHSQNDRVFTNISNFKVIMSEPIKSCHFINMPLFWLLQTIVIAYIMNYAKN